MHHVGYLAIKENINNFKKKKKKKKKKNVGGACFRPPVPVVLLAKTWVGFHQRGDPEGLDCEPK